MDAQRGLAIIKAVQLDEFRAVAMSKFVLASGGDEDEGEFADRLKEHYQKQDKDSPEAKERYRRQVEAFEIAVGGL